MGAKSRDALDGSLLFRLGIRPAYDRAGHLSVLRLILVVGRIEKVAVRTLVEDPARSAGNEPTAHKLRTRHTAPVGVMRRWVGGAARVGALSSGEVVCQAAAVDRQWKVSRQVASPQVGR